MMDSPVDMSKLSERELLILLNERQSKMMEKLDRVSISHYDLERDVDKMKTRYKTAIAVWGSITVIITLVINIFRTFSNGNN